MPDRRLATCTVGVNAMLANARVMGILLGLPGATAPTLATLPDPTHDENGHIMQSIPPLRGTARFFGVRLLNPDSRKNLVITLNE
jgi:hypothetical protein